MKLSTNVFGLATAGLMLLCHSNVWSQAPTVASPATASNVATTTVTLNGQVTSAGGAALSGRGFVLSTTSANSNPAIGGTGVTNIPLSAPHNVGTFLSNRTGLAAATQYSFKAYATNSQGTSYSGTATTFTTLAVEPTAHATAFAITSRSETSIDFSWTAAAGSPAGYIVLRKTTPGTTFTGVPVDGQTYTAGDAIGDATVVSVGSGTTSSASGLTAGSAYLTRVYPYNGTGITTNYRTAATVPNLTPYTLSAEPAAHAASFTTGARSVSSIVLDFSPASSLSNATGYLILRRNGAVAPTGLPADGTAYTVGAAIGDGTVAALIANTATSTVTITGLAASTDYSFTIIPFANNAASTTTYNYRTAATIPSISTRTLAAAPTVNATAMVFSNVTTSSTTVAWSYGGTASGHLILRSTSPGTSTSLPVSGFSYNVGDVIGTSTVVGVGTNLNATATGLSSASTYQYRVFPYNGTGTDLNYRTATPLTGTRYTLSDEPNAHAASFVVSTVGQTSVSLAFSAASTLTNGAGYLILRRTGAAAPSATPVDGVSYAVNAAVGDGTVAAVITNSATTTATITGLAANTQYSFVLIPLNFIAASTQTYNYRTAAVVPTATATTLVAEPTTSSVLTFANVTSSGYTVNWTAATGATQYILLRSTSIGTATPNTAPSDNTAYTVGDVIGNATVAFIGSTRTFAMTGMSPATAHGWAVYPFAGTTPAFNYRQTSPGTGSQYSVMANEPAAYPASFVADFNTGTGAIDLTFSAANTITDATGYIILRRATNAVASVPADGVGYTAGTAIGTSTVAAVITDPTQTTVSISGLTDNTRWFFQLFPYNSDVASNQTNNYRVVATAPSDNDSTAPTPPASQPLNLTFTSITTTGMTLTWQAPTSPTPLPTGYIVLRTTAAGNTYPNTAPVDGTTYTAGNTLGNATVVFSGTTLTTAVTSLLTNSVYSYSIYGFRNNGIARRYNTTSPLQGQRTTLTTEPSGLATISFPANDTTQITAGFGTSGSTPNGYLLLRTTAAGTTQPNTAPTDGIGYTAGATLGNATVVYSGSNTSAVASALAIASRYQFRLFMYNGTGATGNTNYTAGTNGFYFTLARAPQRQPASLVATSQSNTSVTLTFPAASTLTNSTGYLVLMQAGTTPFTTAPSNANSYAEGDAVGTATVAAITTAAATSEVITGLNAGAIYNFALYPFNRDAGGNEATYHYRTSATVATDTAFTIDYEPLVNFRTVQAGSWQVNTTWEREVVNSLGDTVWIALPSGVTVSDSTYNVQLSHEVFLENDVRVNNVFLDSAKTTIVDYNMSIYGQLTRRKGVLDANFNSYVEFTTPVDSLYGQTIPDSAFDLDQVNELIINNPNGVTLATGSDLQVLNNITLNEGSLVLNGNKLTLNGDLGVFSGKLDALPGTLEFNRSTNLLFPPNTLVDNLVENVTIGMAAAATLTLSGTMHIKHHLTMRSGNLATQGNLRLLADSVHTAYIGQVPAASTISGNVVVEQFIPGGRRAFRFIGHPFTGSIGLNQLTDDIDITGAGGSANGFTTTNTNNASAFIYNPLIANPNVANDPGWVAFTNANGSGANAWPTHQGIRILFRGSKGQGLTGTPYTPNPVTIDMTGPINTGNLTFNLPVGTNSGFTIVGNPYPSPINLRLLTRGDSVRPNYHVYNPYAGTTGAYISVPSSVNYVIPAYSGFFASATLAGGGLNQLQFTEAAKSTSAPQLLFRTSHESRQVVASISVRNNNRMWDLLWLMKQAGSRDSVDFVDARKMGNELVNAYTLSQEGRNLSIDTRPFNKAGDDSVRVGFASTFNGDFSFQVDSLNVPTGTQLLLVDRFTGITTTLQSGINYNFTVTTNAASKGNNRFVLVMRNSSVLPTAAFRSFKLRPAGNQVHLDWTFQSQPTATHFDIEKSEDADGFAKIGSAKADDGLMAYSFAAPSDDRTAFYRIVAILADGSKRYSPVLTMKQGAGNELQLALMPNVLSAGELLLVKANTSATIAQARLVDAAGNTVQRFGKTLLSAGLQSLGTVGNHRPGNYILHYQTQDGAQASLALRVQ